jgi:catechol 2,3-dioxygenase-like lactoylglutathione lyase family enzyme
MITACHHITLHVSDVRQSMRLFLALGLPVIPLSAERAFVIAPNGGLMLTQIAAQHHAIPSVHAPGITHLCLQVPQMDGALTRLDATTLVPLSTPVDLRTGHLYLYGHDADRTLFEIEEVPYTPYPTPVWFGHIACVSEDVTRLAHFYSEFITGTVVNPGVIGPNPAYDRVVGFTDTRLHPVWIKRLNLTIELWQFVHPTSPPRMSATPTTCGYHHLALISDDINHDTQRCIALGGALHTRSAHHVELTDCDGNMLYLYTPDHPEIRAVGTFAHAHILAEIAPHWRARSTTE